MRRLTYVALAAAAFALSACGSDSPDPSAGAAAGSPNAAAGSANGTAGSPNGTAGNPNGAAAGASGAPNAGGSGLTTPPGSTPEPMPVISHGVPAFSSNQDPNARPSNANDGMPNTSWSSAALPAWLAYDLSSVPVAQRQAVLIAWYNASAPDYINKAPDAGKHLPIDYLLETNGAAGGGPPPTDGWTNVASITGNNRSTRQRLVDIGGANWVRMTVTKSSDPNIVAFDLDVHSAPNGATDSWLFMGDSITFMMSTYAFSNLPKLVHDAAPGRWPAVIPAGIGGTNTTTALAAIQETMQDFPGRFVTLNYGTNDHANEYQMEALVQAVLAAGKVPVVPHMPWSAESNIQESGPVINQAIDDLYVKYPGIMRGPDFWAIFSGRTDLIPENDIHPNDPGREEFRKQWALAMTR